YCLKLPPRALIFSLAEIRCARQSALPRYSFTLRRHMNLFLRSLRQFFRWSRPVRKSRPRSFRPMLQQLEDRCVPAVTAMEFPIPPPASGPRSIPRASDGNLWFTEFNTDKISRITPAGAVTAEITLPVSGSGPLDIVSGPDGNLYFTERFGDKIGRI